MGWQLRDGRAIRHVQSGLPILCLHVPLELEREDQAGRWRHLQQDPYFHRETKRYREKLRDTERDIEKYRKNPNKFVFSFSRPVGTGSLGMLDVGRGWTPECVTLGKWHSDPLWASVSAPDNGDSTLMPATMPSAPVGI